MTTVTVLLQEFIRNMCSFHDVPKNDLERSMFVLALSLRRVAGMFNRYIVRSNRESGDGRYDIMLTPRNKGDAGVLIEFKKAKSIELAVLEKSAEDALEQIKVRNYASDMRTHGYQGSIFCYGVAVCGKHVVVKMVLSPHSLLAK